MFLESRFSKPQSRCRQKTIKFLKSEDKGKIWKEDREKNDTLHTSQHQFEKLLTSHKKQCKSEENG